MQDLSKTLLIAALVSAGACAAQAAPATKGPAAPAAAPASPVTADVQCVIAMAALGQDKSRQQAAQVGGIFFAGRISARAPTLNLPAAVHAQEALMSPKTLPQDVARCGAIVQKGLQALQASFAPPPGAAPPSAATPAAPPIVAPGAVPPPK